MWIFYRTRFMIAGSIGLILVAIIALVSIAPSYILLIVNRPQIHEVESQKVTDTTDDRAVAQKTKALLSDLAPILEEDYLPTELIEKALAVKPQGILIDRIRYASGDGLPSIVIAGTTNVRGQAEQLRKALEGTQLFERVSIPVGDLVGANGNQFTVTLTLKKPS